MDYVIDNKTKINVKYERLFPKLSKNKYKLLQIDQESISYITTPNTAKEISTIISQYAKINNITIRTIVDCTACIGGDTLALSKISDKVISVEIDKKRCNMLKNNIDVYCLNNVIVINDDCINALGKIEDITVAYFDPPWGGKGYKKSRLLTLDLSNVHIEDITRNLLDGKYNKNIPKMLVFKLPKNYDIENFYTKVNIKEDVVIYLHQLKKLNIIIVINKKITGKYVSVY